MKGQEKMEDNFEKQWREAMNNASVEPPKIVWSEISQHLADQRLATVQRQHWYYQIAAAAAIVLCAFFGYQYFANRGISTNSKTVAVDNTPRNTGFSLPIYRPEFETISIEQSAKLGATPPAILASSDMPLILAENKDQEYLIDFELLERDLAQMGVELAVNFGEVKDQLYGLPATYLVKNKKKEEDRFWAGVDMAFGSFNPNFEGGNTSLSNSLSVKSNQFAPSSFTSDVSTASPPVKEGMTTGQSLGFGFNLGMKISDRWTLQSGLQYSRATATSSTNVVIENRQTVNPIPASSQFGRVSQVQEILNSEETVNYSYKDVSLDNQFQFASIPVKAGFKILDQRLSMGLNAGVAANIYLGNKLTDPTDQLAEVTIGPGSSSPYKQVNFMGLAGIQIGYRIIQRFDVTLEPNYTHALNTLTKSGNDFATNPSGIGLQTGIRYRFD